LPFVVPFCAVSDTTAVTSKPASKKLD